MCWMQADSVDWEGAHPPKVVVTLTVKKIATEEPLAKGMRFAALSTQSSIPQDTVVTVAQVNQGCSTSAPLPDIAVLLHPFPDLDNL